MGKHVNVGQECQPSEAADTRAQREMKSDGGPYGIIGYKDKAWSLRYKGQRYKFVGADGGPPADHIDVVILRQAKARSRSYYQSYDPDAAGGKRPLCTSLDGIRPDSDAAQKQAEKCALCPRNAWKTEADGRTLKECSDYKRLAVLLVVYQKTQPRSGPLLEPALLRVPSASLTDLAAYGEQLVRENYPFFSVVTRIRFDPDKLYPEMRFEAVRTLTEAEAPTVLQLVQSELAKRITGEDQLTNQLRTDGLRQIISPLADTEQPPAQTHVETWQPEQVGIPPQPAAMVTAAGAPLVATVLHPDPSTSMFGGQDVNGQCAKWPDPLDFSEVPIDEAIARVNAAGYFVLTLNGDIYKIDTNGGVVVQKRDGFTTVFASRQARCADGKLIPAGSAWKRSPHRCEYDSIGYWPDNHERPGNSYNLWQRWGIEPRQGDWSIIYNHILDVIADGDERKANFILDWCAQMVQRPWEKPGVALVLRGRKGTGKSLLTEIMAAAIGRTNTLITASGKKLFEKFNWYLADKLLIGAEEAFFAGNRELNDQLKHLLTGSEIEVEQKFGQRISMKSMHRVIMTSNHEQVIAASDDERRFFVCDVSDKRSGDDSYFAPLVRVVKGEDKTTLAAFMHELQTRDIKDWKAERAAREAASIDLARQKLLSLDPPLQWLLERVRADIPQVAAFDDPTASDKTLDKLVRATMQASVNGHNGRDTPKNAQDPSITWRRDNMVRSYREWCKDAQVRGAADYTGEQRFWASIKLLLNKEIFPNRQLFRQSGGERFVVLPPRKEALAGYNRLLGGKVVDVDEGS